LPSVHAMIVSFVILIVALLMFAKIENEVVTLVTLAFLSFFFLYLLRLLNIINKPFKVGQERGNDDVSLFLLYEAHERHHRTRCVRAALMADNAIPGREEVGSRATSHATVTALRR